MRTPESHENVKKQQLKETNCEAYQGHSSNAKPWRPAGDMFVLSEESLSGGWTRINEGIMVTLIDDTSHTVQKRKYFLRKRRVG